MRQETIATEAAMLRLGQDLAKQLVPPTLVYLHGDLGAGKTTLVRGVLRALGHQGAVKSPTYTIVEPYEFADFSLYHFDLYRLRSPHELISLGFDDYLHAKALCFIEWPERGEGVLPLPDMCICIETQADATRFLRFDFRR